ncbi:MAG TPA: hypothetical protein VI356_18200 [Myxococcales bacterium]
MEGLRRDDIERARRTTPAEKARQALEIAASSGIEIEVVAAATPVEFEGAGSLPAKLAALLAETANS